MVKQQPMMDSSTHTLVDDIQAALANAMIDANIVISNLAQSMQFVVRRQDNEENQAVRPIVSSAGEFHGMEVFPAFLRLSQHDRVVVLRRCIVFGYIAPLVTYTQRMIDHYVVNQDGHAIVSGGYQQLVNMVVLDLASTFEDLASQLKNEVHDDFPEITTRPTIRAEA